MTKYDSQSGQSIIELLIVLLILSVVTIFALGSFMNSKPSFSRQNFARELKVSFERARSDSMKRRATTDFTMARVKIESATKFIVATDLNQNQVIEVSEVKQVNLADSNVKIVGSNLIFPITVKFDRRGFMTTTDGGGNTIAPNFTVCENCTTIDTANSKNSNFVSVSPTGTVTLTAGGQTAPVYQNPSTSNVGGSTQINSQAVVGPTPQPSTIPPCALGLICL